MEKIQLFILHSFSHLFWLTASKSEFIISLVIMDFWLDSASGLDKMFKPLQCIVTIWLDPHTKNTSIKLHPDQKFSRRELKTTILYSFFHWCCGTFMQKEAKHRAMSAFHILSPLLLTNCKAASVSTDTTGQFSVKTDVVWFWSWFHYAPCRH